MNFRNRRLEVVADQADEIIAQLIDFGEQGRFLLKPPSLILLHRQLIAEKNDVGDQREHDGRKRRQPDVKRIKHTRRERDRAQALPSEKDQRHRLRIVCEREHRQEQHHQQVDRTQPVRRAGDPTLAENVVHELGQNVGAAHFSDGSLVNLRRQRAASHDHDFVFEESGRNPILQNRQRRDRGENLRRPAEVDQFSFAEKTIQFRQRAATLALRQLEAHVRQRRERGGEPSEHAIFILAQVDERHVVAVAVGHQRECRAAFAVELAGPNYPRIGERLERVVGFR